MGNKRKWYSILLVGLTLLLTASVVLAGGCGKKTKVEPLRSGPLESPFAEILPTDKDLYWSDFFSETFRLTERTTIFSDGSILHSRTLGNEAAGYHPFSDTPKPEGPSVILAMAIYDYPTEEKAIERIRKRKESSLYKKAGDTEYYAKIFGFSPEDIAGYSGFWKEPDSQEVEGEEVIFFRVGQYVGWYKVHMKPAPRFEDGYFIPFGLRTLLHLAVDKTIPNLRSLKAK